MTIVRGNKPTVAAASKQQRLPSVIGISLDRTEENHMIATVITVSGTTLEISDTLKKQRRTAEARRPIDADKFVVRRLCEPVRQRLLAGTKYIDRKVAGVLKRAQARRINYQTPEHQRWVERHRRKGVAGDAIRSATLARRRD